MSWFTDIRDTVTAPFRAGWEFLSAPVDIGASLIRGDGLTDTLRTQIREIGNPTLQTVLPFVTTEKGQEVLKNEQLSKLTLGISSDYAGFTHGLSTLTDSQTLTKDDALSSLRLGAKLGAIAGTAGAAGALGLSAPTVITGIGVGGNLLKGDLSGAANSLGFGGLGDAIDGVNTVNNIFPSQIPSAPGQPAPVGSQTTVSEQASSSSGYRSPAATKSATSSNDTLLMAGLAVGGYLLYRRFGK